MQRIFRRAKEARSPRGQLNAGDVAELKARLSKCKPKVEEATYADLRYTKFYIDGFPGEKHAVFVPDCVSLTEPILRQVCEALGMEVPSLLLCGMSSPCHTKRLLTPQLRSCSGCEPHLAAVKQCLPAEAACDTDKRLSVAMSRALEMSLASAVGHMSRAAARTNVWTLSTPQVTNLEMFLQQCIEAGDTDVFRMAIAHMQDRAYMESRLAKSLMKRLFDHSQEMSQEGTSYVQPISVSGDLWDPAINKSHPEFADHGFEYWSFDTFDQNRVKGHPVTQWPWPHANLFLLFYREEIVTGTMRPEVDWQYQTMERLDQEAIPFMPNVLAPVGYVCFGTPHSERTTMKKRLFEGIEAGSPVILFDNTPNLAKQLSLAISALRLVYERYSVIACKPFLNDGAGSHLGETPVISEILQAISPSKVLQHVKEMFDGSGMDDSEKLTLSDILGLLDIMKRQPQTFKETVCVLDPLTSSHDGSISQLMSVFTSGHIGLQGSNTAGVHHSLVLKAWGLHARLVRMEVSWRRLLMATEVLTPFFLLMSAAIAIFMVLFDTLLDSSNEMVSWQAGWLPNNNGYSVADVRTVLRHSLVAFPLAAAVLMMIQSSFCIAKKWSSVHMAASAVVTEIYQFLAVVGPYKDGAPFHQLYFQQRLEMLATCPLTFGVLEEDLLDGAEDEFMHDLSLLQRHVEKSIYGITGQWQPIRRLVSLCGFFCPSTSTWAWTSLRSEADPNDLTLPVTMETYMETRVIPLKIHYARMARRLSLVRVLLFLLLLLLLGGSILLLVLELPGWIPVTVSLASLVGNFMQKAAPPAVLAALNVASLTLRTCHLRWQDMDTRESRSQAKKEFCVRATEKVAIIVARSLSGSSLSPLQDVAEQPLEDVAEQQNNNDNWSNDQSSSVVRMNLGEVAGRPICVPLSPQDASGRSSPLLASVMRKVATGPWGPAEGTTPANPASRNKSLAFRWPIREVGMGA